MAQRLIKRENLYRGQTDPDTPERARLSGSGHPCYIRMYVHMSLFISLEITNLSVVSFESWCSGRGRYVVGKSLVRGSIPIGSVFSFFTIL